MVLAPMFLLLISSWQLKGTFAKIIVNTEWLVRPYGFTRGNGKFIPHIIQNWIWLKGISGNWDVLSDYGHHYEAYLKNQFYFYLQQIKRYFR